jgi:hypothetical protein
VHEPPTLQPRSDAQFDASEQGVGTPLHARAASKTPLSIAPPSSGATPPSPRAGPDVASSHGVGMPDASKSISPPSGPMPGGPDGPPPLSGGLQATRRTDRGSTQRVNVGIIVFASGTHSAMSGTLTAEELNRNDRNERFIAADAGPSGNSRERVFPDPVRNRFVKIGTRLDDTRAPSARTSCNRTRARGGRDSRVE